MISGHIIAVRLRKNGDLEVAQYRAPSLRDSCATSVTMRNFAHKSRDPTFRSCALGRVAHKERD